MSMYSTEQLKIKEAGYKMFTDLYALWVGRKLKFQLF